MRQLRYVLRSEAVGPLLAMVMTACVSGTAAAQVVVGRHHPLRLETPHPLPVLRGPGAQRVWHEEIRYPGATYIAVHFERFDLPEGASVVISSPDDPYTFTFEGKGVLQRGRFWATHVYGDTALIDVYNTGTEAGFGFVIDKFSAGFLPLGDEQGPGGPEVVCGADDKEHAICWKPSEPLAYDRARAVAALLSHWDAADPGLDRFCTGSLVSCGGYLLTAEHCVPGFALVADTTFEFMAEAPSCTDPNPPEVYGAGATDPPYPGVRFTGGVLVASNFNLDYSLIQVPGNPHLQFGSLGIEDRAPVVDERIYIPQHPMGRGKQFGLDSTHPTDESGWCEVYSLTEPGCAGRTGPDVGYYCDTEGGSSGSPVLAYDAHRIVALHHCGLCPNTAVPINAILADIQSQIGALPPAMPGEVPSWSPDALVVKKVNSALYLRLEWASAAEAIWYNLYRGTLDNLHQGIYDHVADLPAGVGACDLAALSFEDTDDLTSPGKFYYLVTGENGCGEGPTGYDSAGARRPAGSGCP